MPLVLASNTDFSLFRIEDSSKQESVTAVSFPGDQYWEIKSTSAIYKTNI